MSRLASEREYTFMKVLYDAGFPVPRPIDWSRHCILMGRAPGRILSRLRRLRHPMLAYTVAMRVLCRLARSGLVHGDYNEFNILVHEQRTRYGESEARQMLIDAGLGAGGEDKEDTTQAREDSTSVDPESKLMPPPTPVVADSSGMVEAAAESEAAGVAGAEEGDLAVGSTEGKVAGDEDTDEDEDKTSKGWAGGREARDRQRRVGLLDWFNEDGVVLSGGGVLRSRLGRTREIKPGVCESEGVRCVLTAIDFPQMVSVKHVNAKEIFDRDVDCCVKFFRRRYGLGSLPVPTFEEACGPSLTVTQGISESKDAVAAFAATGHEKAAEGALHAGAGAGALDPEVVVVSGDMSGGDAAPSRLDEAACASGFGGAAGATERDELAAMMLART